LYDQGQCFAKPVNDRSKNQPFMSRSRDAGEQVANADTSALLSRRTRSVQYLVSGFISYRYKALSYMGGLFHHSVTKSRESSVGFSSGFYRQITLEGKIEIKIKMSFDMG